MAMKSVLSEYYKKGDNVAKDIDPKQEFNHLPENTIIMKVKHGSKMRNLMGFIEKSLKEETNTHMIFTGCGDAIEKTISCAEITKTKFKNLHQITRLNTFRVTEFWEPTKPDLEHLKVIREIPMIAILLCKEQLDSNEPGYQSPCSSQKSKKPKKRKSSTHKTGEADMEEEKS